MSPINTMLIPIKYDTIYDLYMKRHSQTQREREKREEGGGEESEKKQNITLHKTRNPIFKVYLIILKYILFYIPFLTNSVN